MIFRAFASQGAAEGKVILISVLLGHTSPKLRMGNAGHGQPQPIQRMEKASSELLKPRLLVTSPHLPPHPVDFGATPDWPVYQSVGKAHRSRACLVRVSGQDQIYVQERAQGAASVKLQMFTLQMFHVQFGNLGTLKIAFAHKIA